MIRFGTDSQRNQVSCSFRTRIARLAIAGGGLLAAIVAPAAADTLTFQQGASGYSGAVDTYIQADITTPNGAATLLTADGVPPPTDERQILIRFDNIFGSAGGHIPPGSTITSASLTVNVSNSIGITTSFHRMLQTWGANDIWSTFGAAPWNTTPGVQADNFEAATAADAAPASIATGLQPITVTSSLQTWSSNPSANFGWVLRVAGADSLAFDSSEVATISNRPKLTVAFNPPCDGPEDCSDGKFCTDDVCDNGHCVNPPVVCDPDELCNPATGQCETPPPLPIVEGDTWRYFRGQSEPPAAWKTVSFDDSAWAQGPSGFGYGDNDDATLLDATNPPAMINNYASVYVRRLFSVADLGAVASLELTVDYDDAYVAYINGQEVARSTTMGGTVGVPPAYNALAPTGHEASGGDPASAQPPDVITITNLSMLVQGINVVALQGHNQTLASTDFSLIPELAALAPPDPAPQQPTNPSPADDAISVSTSPQLCVTATDGAGDNDALTVTFYGREATGAPGDPFTIVAIPDPQYYAASYPATYSAQTQWIRDNAAALNIVFVTGLGDMTDNAGAAQWTVADAAFDILEPALTGMPDGIPYGITVGNHDQNPSGSARSGTDEGATTTEYNTFFGKARFQGRGYFGGNYDFGGAYPNSMDNHYELFTASGMDFIIFHLEVDGMGSGYEGTCASQTCADVIAWMDNILTNVYPNRRAIIISHAILQPSGNPPAFMSHGAAIYAAVRDNPNVFLMMCGHLDQANHRADEYPPASGHWIYTLISDYQSRPNGGDGWLRILTFDPQSDTIHVETYSPTLARYINKPTAHADNGPNDACARDCYTDGSFTAGGNELMLPYDMDAGQPWQQIGTPQIVASGGQACVNWPGLAMGAEYEWYVTISDGTTTTTGPTWSFTTGTTCVGDGDCDDGNACTEDTCNDDTHQCEHAPIAGTCTDDGNPCTDDVCSSGACTHPNNSNACTDDGNPCTDDVCSGGACTHSADNSNTCSDDNDCTTADHCSSGDCVGTYDPVAGCCDADADCDDGNAGTTDTCDPEPNGNCSNVLNQYCDTDAECNDDNACTTDDCVGGNAAGLSFDGTNDYVDLGNASTLTNLGTGSFTIEGWIYTNGGNADRTGIVRFGRQGSYMQVAVQLTGTAAPYLAIAGSVETNTTGTQVDVNYQGTAITPNAWHHFALVADRSTLPSDPSGQQLRLHIDGGSAIVANAALWSSNAISSTDAVVFGAARLEAGALSLWYDGRLDEVRVWSYARTQAETLADMYTPIDAAPGLVHRWGMNEGSGATIADDPGTSDGTLKPTPPTDAPVWVTASGDLPDLGQGICQHTPIQGCTPCTTAAQCDDSDACTTDTCVAGRCEHAALVCDDGNVCNGLETCDSQTGCQAGTPLVCNDGNVCNGLETCDPLTGCQPGTPLVCSDGDVCNGLETCDAQAGCQPGTPLVCDDGNVCNGSETCNPASGCQPGTPLVCDDGNVCNGAESCDSASGCQPGLPAADGTPCNDADPCTANDACNAGVCEGDPLCDDGNVCTVDTCEAHANDFALYFDGADDHVTMGQALGLGAAAFTLEAWIKGDGSWGAANATTGTGGLQNAVALIAKGRSEGDGSNIDCAYFFGMDASGRLVADFEQYAATGGWSAGQNHPMCSSAQIGVADQSWHHVAVTYDKASGRGWRFYLDGSDVTAANGTSSTCGTVSSCTDPNICPQNPGVDPRYDSIQHFALGVALNSTGGSPGGYYGGMMDEARVWNYARTVAQIRAAMNVQIPSAPGLIGRWGLNEGAGASAADSTTPSENGTLTNGPAWTTTKPDLNECQYSPVAGCCNTAAECSDGDPCTTDACVDHACDNDPIPECCDADADCDDDNDCTTDACDVNVAAVDLHQSTSDYVILGGDATVPNFINNFGTSSFTIEGWFYADAAPGADNTSIFRGGRQGAAPQVVVQLKTSGGLWIAVSVEGNGLAQADAPAAYSSAASVTLSQWHHFAAVVNRTTKAVSIYLNGGLAGTVTTTWGDPNTINMNVGDTTLLGYTRDSAGALINNFNGRIDEVRIWNYARSQAEIQADRYLQIKAAPGLMHRWGFNEQTGPAIDDPGTFDAALSGGATRMTTPLPDLGTDRCTHTLDAGYCLIDDACHQNGAADPNNACQYCNATTNPNQWSFRTAGTACGDASDTDCTDPDACDNAGHCLANHAAAGATCGDTSDTDCTNPDSCDGNGNCQPNHAADGAPCNDGLYCNGQDTCSGGACDQHAGNPCQSGQTCDEANDVCLSGNEGSIALVVPGPPQSGPQGTIYTVDVVVSGLSVAINGAQVVVHFDHTQLGFVSFAPNAGAGWASPSVSTNPGYPDDLVVGAVIAGGSVGPGGPFTVGTLSYRGLLPGSTAVVSIAAAAPWDPGMTTKLTRYPTAVDFAPTSTTNTTPSHIVILACDDGNACTDDTFDGTACVFANDDSNTCSDGNACTQTDACVAGACVGGSPVVCDDGNECTDDTCIQATGECLFANDDTNTCTDSNPCTSGDHCAGGSCLGTLRDCSDTLACTTDACNETTGDCEHVLNAGYCLIDNACVLAGTLNPANECQWCDPAVSPTGWSNRAPGAACGTLSGDCDVQDTCDGNGACVANYASSSTLCRGAAGPCDAPEYCTGTNAACPDDAKVSIGTECRAAAGNCDVAETCDGLSDGCPADAFQPNTFPCRSAAGACDAAEYCTGDSAVCPADAKVSAGTECRAAAGDCDIAEACDGSSNDCPADAVEPATTTCRAAAGDCDIAEFCDGTNVACPSDVLKLQGALCRAAADQCDAAEYCDGTSAACPADADKPDGAACDDGEYCTVADACHSGACGGVARSCDDGFDCTADWCNEAGDRCENEPTAGYCLIDDTCVSQGTLRPGLDCQWCEPLTNSRAWTNRPAGSNCGGAPSGDCDAQDTCDANGVCVANYASSGTLCRGVAGDCDVPEYCTGSAADCPADQFRAAGALCRGAADQCDAAEYCDGASAACPADGDKPNGTPCDDTLYCTVNDTCVAGECTGAPRDCSDGNNCTSDACDEDANACINVDTTQIIVNLQVEGLLVPPLVSPARTRTVTFVTTDCATQHRETHTVPVTFSSNPVTVMLDEVDPAADWIEIVEGHTLARTLPVAYLPCTATISATGGNRLLSGDFSNPPWVPQTNRVDIQDFAILAVYWNQSVDPNLGSKADANGDGMQDVGDFTAIQANFGVVGNPLDNCVSLPGGGQPTPWGAEPPQDSLILPLSDDSAVRVSAASLGLPHIERADCNGDGWVDLRDVRIFAQQRGLPLLPAFAALIDLYEETYAPDEIDPGALSDE